MTFLVQQIEAISINRLRSYPARKLISWLTAKVLSRGLNKERDVFSPFQWTFTISSGLNSRAVGQRSHKNFRYG